MKLSVAIDLAKELGDDYPYLQELYEAEDHLYDLMQCPEVPHPEADEPLPVSENDSFEASEAKNEDEPHTT